MENILFEYPTPAELKELRETVFKGTYDPLETPIKEKFNPFTYTQLLQYANDVALDVIEQLHREKNLYFHDNTAAQIVGNFFTMFYGCFGVDPRKVSFMKTPSYFTYCLTHYVNSTFKEDEFFHLFECIVEAMHQRGDAKDNKFVSKNKREKLIAREMFSDAVEVAKGAVLEMGDWDDDWEDEEDDFESNLNITIPMQRYLDQREMYSKFGIKDVRDKILFQHYETILNPDFATIEDFFFRIREWLQDPLDVCQKTFPTLTTLMERVKRNGKKHRIDYKFPNDFKEQMKESLQAWEGLLGNKSVDKKVIGMDSAEEKDKSHEIFFYSNPLAKKPASKPESSYKEATLRGYLDYVPGVLKQLEVFQLNQRELKLAKNILTRFLTAHYRDYRQTWSQITMSSVFATLLKEFYLTDDFDQETALLAAPVLSQYFLHTFEEGKSVKVNSLIDILMDYSDELTTIQLYRYFDIPVNVEGVCYK